MKNLHAIEIPEKKIEWVNQFNVADWKIYSEPLTTLSEQFKYYQNSINATIITAANTFRIINDEE